MTLQLHATPEEVMRAVEVLREFCRTLQLPEKVVYGLALGLEECASNIVNHAFRGDSRQTFQVAIEHTGDVVSIELRDPGPEFDPTRVQPLPPVTGKDDRPPGNWGLQLVRHYIDEIRYTRVSGKNVLRLTKHLVQGSGPTPLCPTDSNNINL